jgi:spermidine/putrescine transport system permease protein
MVQEEKIFTKFLTPLIIVSTYIFLYLPVLVLIIFSFNDSLVSIKWSGFTLKWYVNLIHSPQIWEALRVSLIVSFSSTLLSLVLGTSAVLAGKWWRGSLLNNIFYVNIILPDIILAVGVLSIFAFFKIPLGYASLIVGHSLLGLGFAIPIIRSRFSELDPELTEASLDLGAKYGQTFSRIILPLLRPALISAGLLVFTISLDDFLISFFCSSSEVQTLSVYVYSMIKTWVDPTINAISTFLLFTSSIMVLLLTYFKVIDQVFSDD